MDPSGSGIVSTAKNGWIVFLFEFLGTMMLCVFQKALSGATFAFAVWGLLCVIEPISGAHFNPAVTMAFMLRQDAGSFNRVLGFTYIIIQCVAMFVGALLGWMLTKNSGTVTVFADRILAALMIELVGVFFYVLTFLI